MENKDLVWIKDVIVKLQVPQTYNERQRLTKILQDAAPAMIEALDHTVASQYGQPRDDNKFVATGQTCNGCGQDYWYDEGNPKHMVIGMKRDGTGGEQCKVEHLFQTLAELEVKQDK